MWKLGRNACVRETGTQRRGGVVPVRERDDRGLVVNVVEVGVRVVRVVNNEGATETIAVLSG